MITHNLSHEIATNKTYNGPLDISHHCEGYCLVNIIQVHGQNYNLMTGPGRLDEAVRQLGAGFFCHDLPEGHWLAGDNRTSGTSCLREPN